MRFLFLGCLLPDPIYKDIVKNSRGGVSNAADALQKSFIEGLSEIFNHFEILNFPAIGMWPHKYKQLYFKEFDYNYETYKGKKILCHNPAFLNLYVYSRHEIFKKIYASLSGYMEKSEEPVCVFVYAILPWVMHACHKLKEKYGDSIRFILIVPDLPEYQGTRDFFHELLLKKRQKEYKQYYKAFSGYILLTKYMAERIPVCSKPWIVIEGIYNYRDDKNINLEIDTETKSIFYSGTLNKRFGILNLLEAFSRTTNPSYRLVLCGAGDTESEIREKASKDNRICFLGSLPRSAVLEKQKEATLLINPRTPEGEFTRYSFPSKTMEYLASGVPTLLYELPGIPEEYYNYCFHISELGVDALKKKIEEILSIDSKMLQDKGKTAREFILKNKNPYVQCEKIKPLLKEIEVFNK